MFQGQNKHHLQLSFLNFSCSVVKEGTAFEQQIALKTKQKLENRRLYKKPLNNP